MAETPSVSEAIYFPPLSLRRNFAWTLAGNVVYAGCQWGMLMVLAKLGTTEMVGRFALGLALAAPVVMFTNLQLRVVQATDATQEYLFGDYLGLRLIMVSLAFLVIAGIAVFGSYPVETKWVVAAVGVAKIFEAVSDILYGLLQQYERMDRIAKSMMIKGILSLLALGFAVYLTRSVLWGTLGLAGAWALVLIGYDIPSAAMVLKASRQRANTAGAAASTPRAALQPRWDPGTLRRLVLLSLPLGFAMMLLSLNTNLPRYFIAAYLSEANLGVFAALAQASMAGALVVRALAHSASPRMAKHYATGNAAAFRTLLLKLVVVGVALGGTGVLLAVAAGQEILTILYRPEYGDYANVFVWIMGATGLMFVCDFLEGSMTSARRFAVQVPLTLVSNGVLVVACVALIPSLKLMGAALATVIAATVRLLGGILINWYILRCLKD